MAFAKYDKEQAIFLRKIGWSYKEISDFMNCSENWCKTRLSEVQKDVELMHKVAVIAQMYIKQVKEEDAKSNSI